VGRLHKFVLRVRVAITGLLFDRRLGVETAGLISRKELGYSDQRNTWYQPSRWWTLRRMIPRRSVGPDDVFLDMGSGMGRVVFFAAGYPFKRVIGMELSSELHEVAVRNLESIRDKLRCRDVVLEQADARTYEMPDDVTIVFLYNPFQGEIFDAAIASLLRSVERNPRPVRIIYSNPVEHERLLATGRFKQTKVWRARGWSSGAGGEADETQLVRNYELIVPEPRGAGAL
jgi:SAM-dependent methyltransferase